MSSFVRHKLYGAIMFIDLDGFKSINDNQGHDAGDAILVNVASRLKAHMRTEDIVSRVGGDEFVVVLSQLDVDDKIAREKAVLVSGRIQKGLCQAIDYKNTALQIGASIGLSMLTPERKSVDSALKEADTAMYRAKQSGKGCIVVFE